MGTQVGGQPGSWPGHSLPAVPEGAGHMVAPTALLLTVGGGSCQRDLACPPAARSLSRRAHPKVADASASPWSLNTTGQLLQIQERTRTHRAGGELRWVVVHVRHCDDGGGCVGEAVVQVPFHVCGLNDDHVLLDFLEGTRGKNRTAVWV